MISGTQLLSVLYKMCYKVGRLIYLCAYTKITEDTSSAGNVDLIGVSGYKVRSIVFAAITIRRVSSMLGDPFPLPGTNTVGNTTYFRQRITGAFAEDDIIHFHLIFEML